MKKKISLYLLWIFRKHKSKILLCTSPFIFKYVIEILSGSITDLDLTIKTNTRFQQNHVQNKNYFLSLVDYLQTFKEHFKLTTSSKKFRQM